MIETRHVNLYDLNHMDTVSYAKLLLQLCGISWGCSKMTDRTERLTKRKRKRSALFYIYGKKVRLKKAFAYSL